MPKVKNLQQKMVLFLLLPVAVLLIAMGGLGLVYARNNILREWQQAALLRLQAAAHQVDMRLAGPKFWMQMFGKTGGEPQSGAIQAWIVKQLDQLQGVEKASIIAAGKAKRGGSQAVPEVLLIQKGDEHSLSAGSRHTTPFDWAKKPQVESPRYDNKIKHKTVSLVSDLMNARNEKVARLKVDVLFSYLLSGVPSHGWRQEETASLIDDRGDVLACSNQRKSGQFCEDKSAYQAVLKAMKNHVSGTLIGDSNSDEAVIGYYRLKEAPWVLVLTANSSQIFAPLIKFRNICVAAGALFVIFIMVLIRTMAGQVVSSIRSVSLAARKVADGNYQVQLVNGSSDEVGQLIRSFNTMVAQLEERMRLKAALDLAMEVQQNLLPGAAPAFDGLDVAGTSVYCEETGGDYYDFLNCCASREGKPVLAIGDVAGHGISAALLMTTVRAMLRMRILQPGNLGEVVADVNRLLCCDTDRSGDFMTLFVLAMDLSEGTLHWVRAGHVPAIIYDWQTDAFEELGGEGMALGVMESGRFVEHCYRSWNGSKLLFLGTDGIWETRNPQGEQFGTERLRAVLRRHSRCSSQQIVDAVLSSIRDFRSQSLQEDDITMMVVKSGG